MMLQHQGSVARGCRSADRDEGAQTTLLSRHDHNYSIATVVTALQRMRVP